MPLSTFSLRQSGAAVTTWIIYASLCMAANPMPARLQVCAALKNNSERLACYDQAVTQPGEDEVDGSSGSSPQSVFGITAKAPATAHEEIKTLSASIVQLRLDAYGAVVCELDNGQTWRQLSASDALLLNPGDRVSITRGVLGSFILNTASGRSTKVRRIH